MTDLSENKIKIFTGINDVPIEATVDRGLNISEVCSKHNNLIDSVTTAITELTNRIDNLENNDLTDRVNLIENKLNTLDTTVINIETSISTLTASINEIKNGSTETGNNNTESDNQLPSHSSIQVLSAYLELESGTEFLDISDGGTLAYFFVSNVNSTFDMTVSNNFETNDLEISSKIEKDGGVYFIPSTDNYQFSVGQDIVLNWSNAQADLEVDVIIHYK